GFDLPPVAAFRIRIDAVQAESSDIALVLVAVREKDGEALDRLLFEGAEKRADALDEFLAARRVAMNDQKFLELIEDDQETAAGVLLRDISHSASEPSSKIVVG